MIINENNYLEAIALLNDFFKGNQTREYVGIKEHWVKDEEVPYDGQIYKQAVYEKRETYNVFVAQAQTHWLKDEPRFRNPKPLIALSDIWASNCIALHPGDEIIFETHTFGYDECIINNDICGTTYTRTFFKMPYTQEELIEHMNYHILDKVYDEFYEYKEEFEGYDLDNTENLIDVANTIQEEIWKEIKKDIHGTEDINFELKFKFQLYDSVLKDMITKENKIHVTINRNIFWTEANSEELFNFHTGYHILTAIIDMFGIKLTQEEREEDDHYYDYY